LLNAHAHLELSDFAAPLGEPNQGFPAWIREVVQWRRAQPGSPEEQLTQRRAAVERGRRESLAAGVTHVNDIASPGWQVEWHGPSSPQVSVYEEVLGLSTAREEALTRQAQQAVDCGECAGLSPHAPYTVGLELLRRLAQLGAPLAMHLAESPDELELLQSHSGAFLALLTELNAWDPAAIPRGISILDYLRILAAAPSALVIHGNYLNAAEQDFLAAHRDRLTLVYCPRTHAYFGHPRYPLADLLHKGINVKLGTDSRASNPDLNLWNELRFVADAYPELSLETIFRLGLDAERDIEIGRPASFVLMEIPADETADPYELLFDSRSRVVAVYEAGRRLSLL
jgi:cytosine/adenosine deaminase-related metal-dependent hydrolase